MHILFTVAASIAVISSAPATSTSPNPEKSEQVEKEETREEKKICRRIQSMGSRRTERVCMTKEQWREFNQGN